MRRIVLLAAMLVACDGNKDTDSGDTDTGASPEASIDPVGVLYAGGTIVLSGTATDPDDASGDLVVELSSQRAGGLWTGSPDADGTWSWTGTLSEGEHELRLHVTDPAGHSIEIYEVVEVQGNAAPTCAIVSPEDGGAYCVTTSVLLDAEGEDPNNDPIDYFWTGNGSALVLGQTFEYKFKAGEYLIELSGEDPDGLECTDSVQITVSEDAC